MNLRNLSDAVLLSEAKKLAKEERELLTTILHHLREIERRRLFSSLKYSSVHEYAMKELNYSQDQAGRRVAASRLLKELPEIEEKINSGSLNLTTLGLAQTLFQREKKEGTAFTEDKKMEVIKKLENKSTREAQSIVWSFSSLPPPEVKETIKMISDEVAEYNFAANKETQKNIERLKGLLGHSRSATSLGELIEKLCELGLKEWDPARQVVRKTKVAAPRLEGNENKVQRNEVQKKEPVQNKESLSQAEISRRVWRQAQSRCENCGSYYALQEDHRFPRAMGGSSTLKNMRLLCRSCNQRAAIEAFGLKKMEQYLT